MKSGWNRKVLGWLISAAVFLGGMAGVFAQPAPPASPTPAPTAVSPLTQLAWDADRKETNTGPNQATAGFSFGVTNISDSEVVIDHVKGSCSCTVAKLPSQPWHLAPHTNGQIGVAVDLKGKFGDFEKRLTVFFADKNTPPKILTVKVKMPDRKIMRERNTEMSKADRQAVFKGDCAVCHAEPAKHESGMALYHQVCGICHEARPRADMVPDLRLLPHPTDYAFWKEFITNGKTNTLMPAFAISQGGPLTDEQIDSLAKAIDTAFPYSRFGGNPPQPVAVPAIRPPHRIIPSAPGTNN